uniref:Uncharacterized protein n=1 Tax=Panagrolaimus superbus TaxID=310955 RepID=A0A914YEA1_9BILA
MKNYDNHFNELQKQLQKVQENSTDEFKEYFLQLFQEAEKRWKKSRDDYEHLNRKCAKSLPSTATKLLQHPFNESKDEPYKNYQTCNYQGNDYQKFDGDRFGTLKYLEFDPQENEETTVNANLRGKREAFKSKEIVTKRFKDDK